jgi:hypothetical protein
MGSKEKIPLRRNSNMKQLSVFLSILSLLALSGMVHVQAVEEITGSFPANDGNFIDDFELKELLDLHIGDNYHSRILAFTECFGGDKIDNFAGDRDTTILSGSMAGDVTYYYGYHRALANFLKPGSDSDTAHAMAVTYKNSLDTPIKSGPNVDIGTGGDGGNITSTHVLVWAGYPEQPDQKDINDIHNNFSGKPNTTVTVLYGDGTGTNVDAAATRANLVDALKTIGAMMNMNEQFIWFSTDHGSQGLYFAGASCPPSNSCNYTINVPFTSWIYPLIDEDNVPYISLITVDDTPILPGELQVSLNNTVGPIDVGSIMIELPMDNDNDGNPEKYEYQHLVTDNDIFLGQNNLLLQTGPQQMDLSKAGFVIGAIEKTDASLVGDADIISAGTGGGATLSLQAGGIDNPNRPYLVLANITGSFPGTPLSGGETLPLNWDPLTNLSIELANTPVFQNTLGTLDSKGRGQAKFETLGPLPPEVIGEQFNLAFVLLNTLDFVSNAWPINIWP